MTTQIKLTKKYAEIVDKMKRLESEQGCQLYFMYNHHSGKVHAVRIDEMKDNGVLYTQFDILCTHNVALTMQNKGVIKSEKIATLKDGSDFALCRLSV